MQEQQQQQLKSNGEIVDQKRKLVGRGGQCAFTLECDGILDCCQGIAPSGFGLCFPKCDGVIGEYCTNNEMCGPRLKCCGNQCVAGTSAEETCLSAQQQLGVLQSQLAQQQVAAQRKRQQLVTLQAVPIRQQNAQQIQVVQADLSQIEAVRQQLEQDQLRVQYLNQLQAAQNGLNQAQAQLAARQANVLELQQAAANPNTNLRDGGFSRRIQNLNVREESSSSSDVPIAAIIGGVIGVILIALVTCIMIRFIIRRNKQPRDPQDEVLQLPDLPDNVVMKSPSYPTHPYKDVQMNSIFTTEAVNHSGLDDQNYIPDILQSGHQEKGYQVNNQRQQMRSPRKHPRDFPQEINYYHQ